jgi:hypothetical protein
MAPDSLLRRDSTAVADSLLRVDSIRRAEQLALIPDTLPALISSSATGFGMGVWVWDQEALLREGVLTIGDLLRRIPGLQSLRSGGYGQPEAATAFGVTRGRVEVEIDGYVLDPLVSSTYDLARIELINLAGLRVERRMDLLRISIRTAQPVLDRPYTRIEAATGQPDANAFRGLFLVPKVIIGPLGLALDRLDTDGIRGSEPASIMTGWAKWSWTNATRGMQLEFRRQNLEREAGSPWPSKSTRDDVILRARATLLAGLTAELYGGRSSIEKDPDSIVADLPDSLQTPSLERGTWQAGARAAYTHSGLTGMAALRIRDAAALPSQELELTAGYVRSLLQVEADFTQQNWSGDVTAADSVPVVGSATSWDVRAQIGPFAGIAAFGEYADGDRGAPIYADSGGLSVRDAHRITSRNAMRAGALLNRFGVQAGAAYVRLDGPATAPFGLPFDSAFAASRVTPATGMEAWGRIGFFRDLLAIDASYNTWFEAPGWTYLPTRNWRIAGELHMSPLASGNLEIFARLEDVRRGPMLSYGDADAAPPVPGDTADARFTLLPPNHMINGYLQIRIMDVRGFLQWEDILGQGRLDFPDRLMPGPRVYYGVKWQLFN